MAVLNFIVNEIFGQGAIFISLIAMVGLLLQKKPVSEIIRGTFMTAIGYVVLNSGVGMVSAAVTDIGTAFSTIMPKAIPSVATDIGGQFGTEIGIVCHQPAGCPLHQVEDRFPDRPHAVLVPLHLHRCRC